MARTTFLRKSNGTSHWLWLSVAALVLIADQFTKVLIVSTYQLGQGFAVSSFLATAGGWQRWFFTGLGLVATVAMVWMLKKHPGQKLFGFAIACILGGAIGNVMDRVLYGYVIDFLDFYHAGIHFPAFNVADSGITLGAVCLILDEVLRVRRGH
jgi:signal peptidase II